MEDNSITPLLDQIRSLTTEGAEKPTLIYFDIRGVAWPIRCLLSMNDVDFDDIKIPVEAWLYRDKNGHRLIKQSFKGLHIPVYMDQGAIITQSLVIMEYLADKYGMLGTNTQEQLQVKELMCHCHDALFHFCGMLPATVTMGIDKATIEKRKNAFMGKDSWGLTTDGFHVNLKGFENYLKRNKSDSGFMVGDRLTYADLHSFNVLYNWYKAYDREVFSQYKLLDEYIHYIGKIPKIAEYLAQCSEQTTWLPMPQAATNLTSTEELEGLLNY